jgi:hypothetical protein
MEEEMGLTIQTDEEHERSKSTWKFGQRLYYEMHAKAGGPDALDRAIADLLRARSREHIVLNSPAVGEDYPGHPPGEAWPTCPMCRAEGRKTTICNLDLPTTASSEG